MSAAKLTLDLHGIQKDEVHALLDRFLLKASHQSAKQVRVMTGKGTGIVRAEVIRLLKLGHYPWQYEKGPNGKQNEGVLVVFVND